MRANYTNTNRKLNMKQKTQTDGYCPTATEMADAEQQYLFSIELGALEICSRFQCNLGRPFIMAGAANLSNNPDYFDSTGKITTAGVEALIEAGLVDVWRRWRKAIRDLPNLTLRDIDVIREFQGLSPLWPYSPPTRSDSADENVAGQEAKGAPA